LEKKISFQNLQKKFIVTNFEIFFWSDTLKIFYAVAENFLGREIQLFRKMDKNKCPFLTFPKKSWKKK